MESGSWNPLKNIDNFKEFTTIDLKSSLPSFSSFEKYIEFRIVLINIYAAKTYNIYFTIKDNVEDSKILYDPTILDNASVLMFNKSGDGWDISNSNIEDYLDTTLYDVAKPVIVQNE